MAAPSKTGTSTEDTSGAFYNKLQHADIELRAGNLYQGIVTTSDTTMQTCSVSIDGVLVDNCVYAAGTMAAYFGLSFAGLPPVGALVLVFYNNVGPSLILGVLHNQRPVNKHSHGMITGHSSESDFNLAKSEAFKLDYEATTNQDGVARGRGPFLPADLVPGEVGLTLGSGTMVRLLQNFAQLSASDAAKVETCLLNDMVRIVSNYFVHHSCGGDELIWSTGRCTKENHFTSYGFEADGKKEESEAFGETQSEFNCDPSKNLENATGDTGRWRVSEYMGFLGDMIHRWVTTPTEVMSNIMEGALRAGQFRSWIGSDGTYCIQAAGGVQVEVTQYITIPEIKKAWNDPEFDMKKAMEDLNSEFLKVWGSGPDWKDLKVACWQLQYYSKYITLWHSLARFRQLERSEYCKIPIESELPERKPTCDEADKEAAVPEAGSRNKGHAILSMDPAGSIAMVSNAKTSIIMNEGNIQIACPGNLEFKAGGTINMQANNVSIRGAQRVELTSLFGELVTTARTSWRALCEFGTLWLKSDAHKEQEVEDIEGADKLAPEEESEFKEYAVVIDAAEGRTLVHGHEGIAVVARKEESNIIMQADGKDSSIYMHAQKNIEAHSFDGNFFVRAKNWLTKIFEGYLFQGGYKHGINFADVASVKEGKLHAKILYTDLIAACNAVLGQSEHISVPEDGMDDYEPQVNTPELTEEIKKASKPEELQKKKASKELSEQFSVSFKTTFAWDKVYKTFEADSPGFSFYEAPYESFAKCDPDNYVRIKLSDIKHKKPGKRTKWTTFPQPITTYQSGTKKEDAKDLLGLVWDHEFRQGEHIKGMKGMTPEEYTYTFIEPLKTETGFTETL